MSDYRGSALAELEQRSGLVKFHKEALLDTGVG
jgi:hypothetical protein